MRLRDLAILEEALEGEIHLIALRGQVDGTSAPRIQRRITAAIEAGRRGVVLDLTLVRDIDRPMLTALLSGARHIAHHRGRLAIVCVHPRLRRVLRVTGLDTLLDVVSSRGEALLAVNRCSAGGEQRPAA